MSASIPCRRLAILAALAMCAGCSTGIRYYENEVAVESISNRGDVNGAEQAARANLASLDKAGEPKNSLNYLGGLITLAGTLHEKNRSAEACEIVDSVMRTLPTGSKFDETYQAIPLVRTAALAERTALYMRLRGAECALERGDADLGRSLLHEADTASLRDGMVSPNAVVRNKLLFARLYRKLKDYPAALRHIQVAEATSDYTYDNANLGPHLDKTVLMSTIERLRSLLEYARICLETGQLQKAESLAAQGAAALHKSRSRLPGQFAAIEFEYDFLGARLLFERHRQADAIALSDKYTDWLESTILAPNDQSQGYISSADMREALRFRLRLLSRLAADNHVADAILQANHLIKLSETARALANASEQLGASNPETRRLLRGLHDADERLRDTQLSIDRLRAQQAPAVALQQAQGTIEVLTANRDALRAALAANYPRFSAVRPDAALPRREVQEFLSRGQAILSFVLGDDHGSYVTVVRRDSVRLVSLGTTASEIGALVKTVRQSLVPDARDELPPFAFPAAANLYAKLLAPAEPSLEQTDQLIVVPDAALNGLPFSLMRRAAAPSLDDEQWAIDKYAFSVVPSIEAPVRLRRAASVAPGREPFLGIGNPVFRGRLAANTISARSVLTRASFATPGAAHSLADTRVLGSLEPLPETAEELDGIRRSLSAPLEALLLGTAATETSVKRLPLDRYRVIAFATHGVMADELDGIAQPGLVLTPPAQPNEVDDGYLSADEIIGLGLNADLVLLSACNTAAPAGNIRGEGFSGLARAFLYAGARSVLASHWSVVSEPTVQVTTVMIDRWTNNGLSKPAALQAAMRKLKSDRRYRHPVYWAPFDLVGD